MKVEIKSGRPLAAPEQRLLERRVARLRRRLQRNDPDTILLMVTTTAHPRTGRSGGHARLMIGNRTIIAQHNTGDTPGSVIVQMFDDLERQLGAVFARRRATRRRQPAQ